MVPLIISRKAENNSKNLGEWDKIKEYGKKINVNCIINGGIESDQPNNFKTEDVRIIFKD